MKMVVYSFFLFFVLVSFLSCSAGRRAVSCRPLFIAHRGGVSLGPENSLSAIERSMLLGVDAVEVDVRLSADGSVVLMHDKAVDRTTNGKGRVENLSLGQLKELLLLDADGNVTDESVPTLAEVFELVGGRCRVLVDVKECNGRGIERAVADVVVRYGACGWVAVQSFSDVVLGRFASLGVGLSLEKLFVFKLPFVPYIFDGGLRRLSFEKYCHVSSFNVYKRFVNAGLVRRFHKAGTGVKVWTLRSGDSLGRMGADAVITDCPDEWLTLPGD